MVRMDIKLYIKSHPVLYYLAEAFSEYSSVVKYWAQISHYASLLIGLSTYVAWHWLNNSLCIAIFILCSSFSFCSDRCCCSILVIVTPWLLVLPCYQQLLKLSWSSSLILWALYALPGGVNMLPRRLPALFGAPRSHACIQLLRGQLKQGIRLPGVSEAARCIFLRLGATQWVTYFCSQAIRRGIHCFI